MSFPGYSGFQRPIATVTTPKLYSYYFREISQEARLTAGAGLLFQQFYQVPNNWELFIDNVQVSFINTGAAASRQYLQVQTAAGIWVKHIVSMTVPPTDSFLGPIEFPHWCWIDQNHLLTIVRSIVASEDIYALVHGWLVPKSMPVVTV